jgi:hypothetical protein
MNELPIHWGIRCPTCLQFIPFGIRPPHAYGSGSALLKSGVYECYKGHTHVYFPEDIRFFRSLSPVTAAQMQANLASYRPVIPRTER